LAEVIISFREVTTHGFRLNDDVFLVCNGQLLEENKIKLSSHFSMHHALQSGTSEQDHPFSNSYVIMTPLHEKTSVNIFIKEEKEDFHVQFVFNFRERKIYLEPGKGHQRMLSSQMAASLFSCFGIKKGKKVFYITDHFIKNMHVNH
jgi:hypothetical protein